MNATRPERWGDIEATLLALEAIIDTKVLIRPRGRAAMEEELTFWLRPCHPPEVRAEVRARIRRRLEGLTDWANVLICERGRIRRAHKERWPAPPAIPFPQDLATEPKMDEEGMRSSVKAEVLILDPAPQLMYQYDESEAADRHSRYSPSLAAAVLRVLLDTERRMTADQLAEALRQRGRRLKSGTLTHTLADMTRHEELTNVQREEDDLGTGYFPTPQGRIWLESHQTQSSE